MTEQEFYELKNKDRVVIDGELYEYQVAPCFDLFAKISDLSSSYYSVNRRHEVILYIDGQRVCTLNFKSFLESVKLIKSNVPTIDQQIQETKSEIEKLQNHLKKLESEKNSKRIEQLISEMVPGKFYTIKYTNLFYPNGKTFTGRLEQIYKDCLYIQLEAHQIVPTFKSIKDIIPREDITNDYNNLMEKIKKYNGE